MLFWLWERLKLVFNSSWDQIIGQKTPKSYKFIINLIVQAPQSHVGIVGDAKKAALASRISWV